ncbi:23797_t:CDS:2, partial [Gigaspora margarita]
HKRENELIQASTAKLEDGSDEENALKNSSDEDISDNEDCSDKENLFSSIQFKNPLKVATKNRPKSVSHHKDNDKINKYLTYNNENNSGFLQHLKAENNSRFLQHLKAENNSGFNN